MAAGCFVGGVGGRGAIVRSVRRVTRSPLRCGLPGRAPQHDRHRRGGTVCHVLDNAGDRQVIAAVGRAGGCFGRRDEQGDKLWGRPDCLAKACAVRLSAWSARGWAVVIAEIVSWRKRAVRARCDIADRPWAGSPGDAGARGAWRSLLKATHGDHVGSDQQQLEVPNTKLGTDTRASMRSRCGCGDFFVDNREYPRYTERRCGTW